MTQVFNVLSSNADTETAFKLKCDSQSLSFYSEIAVYIANNIAGFDKLTVLDVGARTAAGTALLRAIFHPESFSRLKFSSVTALDLDAVAIAKAKLEYPDLEYLVEDVRLFAGIRNWDLVLASHTIEHVPDPDAFIGYLEAVANKYVLIACPIYEDQLSVGHSNRFTIEFFERHNFTNVIAFRSLHWHGGLACLAIKKIAK
jgi:2-polyprenyl-3-methyl-5-hydroxy-6-metoxy-1,4-benzoquinol methylase